MRLIPKMELALELKYEFEFNEGDQMLHGDVDLPLVKDCCARKCLYGMCVFFPDFVQATC